MRAFADVAGLIWGRTTGVPGLVPAAQLSGVCTRSAAPCTRQTGSRGSFGALVMSTDQGGCCVAWMSVGVRPDPDNQNIGPFTHSVELAESVLSQIIGLA